MHPAIEEIEELIATADLEGAKFALSALLSTLTEMAASATDATRFRSLRREGLLLTSEFANLKTQMRRGTQNADQLALQQRQLTFALLELLEEINKALTYSSVPIPVASPVMDTELSSAIPEKVYGRGNLKSVSWLARGMEVGKSVCRIITPHDLGTGFLISGGRVITNNHVIPNAKVAAESRVEFNFERDSAGNLKSSSIYKISAEKFFTIGSPWDCSVLTLAEPSESLVQWGSLELCGDASIQLGDPVTIIQHPNGGEKQIAVTANEIVAITQGKLAYLTDTLGGSSGSPVFNERWQVIALHRAGGALVQTTDGETLRANEGVLFSHLLTLLDFRDAVQKA